MWHTADRDEGKDCTQGPIGCSIVYTRRHQSRRLGLLISNCRHVSHSAAHLSPRRLSP